MNKIRRSLLILSLPLLFLSACGGGGTSSSAAGGAGGGTSNAGGGTSLPAGGGSLAEDAMENLVKGDKELLVSKGYEIKIEQYTNLGTYETSLSAPSGSLYCFLTARADRGEDSVTVRIYYFYDAAVAKQTYDRYPSYYDDVKGNRLIYSDPEYVF